MPIRGNSKIPKGWNTAVKTDHVEVVAPVVEEDLLSPEMLRTIFGDMQTVEGSNLLLHTCLSCTMSEMEANREQYNQDVDDFQAFIREYLEALAKVPLLASFAMRSGNEELDLLGAGTAWARRKYPEDAC